jgi:MFS family permease
MTAYSLEARYRSALRWYPSEWRASNQDAVVGTLLDAAEADGRTRPHARELVNLAANGLATRLRRLPAAVPSGIRDRAATAALAVGAAMSLSAAMQLESASRAERFPFFAEGPLSTFGPFVSPMIVVYGVWLLGFLVGVARQHAAARWLVLATLPLGVAARLVADGTGMLLRPTWTFVLILMLLALLVALGTPVAKRSDVRTLVIWFVLALGFFTLPQTVGIPDGTPFQNPLWLDPSVPVAFLLLGGALSALVLLIAKRRGWAGAVVLVTAPFGVATLTEPFGPSAFVTIVGAATLALLLLLRLLGLRFRVERIPRV